MAQLNITKTYDDGLILTEADLDNIKNDVETFLNVTKISDDNIQDAGITASSKLVDASISTAKYANASVTAAKLAADAVGTASIADDAVGADELRDDASIDANRAVTTNHIRDNAITMAKIADDAVGAAELRDDAVTDANRAVTTDHIRDLAITNAKIADGTIETDKLNDSIVTMRKLADKALQGTASVGNVLLAGSSGSFSTTSTSFVNITNLSGSLSVYHRPVILTLMQDRSTTNAAYISTDTDATVCEIRLLRDGSQIGSWQILLGGGNGGTGIKIPPSSVQFLDDPGFGTYTYTLQAKVAVSSGGSAIRVFNCILVAYEM